jgi:hypothetical protein
MEAALRETPVERRARDLYAVYCASSNGLNYQGLPCPAWDALNDAVRGHWYTVALRTEQIHSDENIGVGSETEHPPSGHVIAHLPSTAMDVWRRYSELA